MSTPSHPAEDGGASPQPNGDPNPPTFAAFAPTTLGQSTPHAKLRSTILVHQKSPLLVATPPQITRVLAYSHPFLVPLNKVVGLLTWTTGDPWESFLLVAAFWAITIYGDAVIRWTGPLVVVFGLIFGMYARRYSPLSSTGWMGEKGQKGHKRAESEGSTRHHKSLDEIVDTLKLLTSRCNILLDPMLRLTDFLSTQRTATSASTRPALTTLFIRISFVTPVWIILTLPPLYIITTKRVIVTFGTLVLSWHSRPARVSRTILWRSKTVRRVCTTITGLDFGEPVPKNSDGAPALPKRTKTAQEIAASLVAKRRPDSPGIRFTFTLFENQRRWLGIGWTASMLAYERASWTDEHLNPAPSKDSFDLPDVEGGHARWRWAEESEWRIDGYNDDSSDDESKRAAKEEAAGWIYYDNKWRDGRRGLDGWGRYTRRRKWCRDAELVEVTPSTEITPSPTPKVNPAGDVALPDVESSQLSEPTPAGGKDIETASSKSRKRRWFKKSHDEGKPPGKPPSDKSSTMASSSSLELNEEEDVHSPLNQDRENEWGLNDDIRMTLG
ncbi:Pex24p-domain-containing protein [Lophium mytilinum]|uniref:Pex24p-domain-containing protein n=1 Tax=Lophium mytilinum TaxID=390894 RepID=A0A6A6R924_9PEZI|nr:Pex24p-domain-containing protein [Lophium mytilinum]